MKKQEEKMFEDRFNLFWERLTQKGKIRNEIKDYYHRTMLNHFRELNKELSLDRSLFYVFNIPESIINYNEIKQQRTKRPASKYFFDVIKYYLEEKNLAVDIIGDDISIKQQKPGRKSKAVPEEDVINESAACNHIYYQNQSSLKKSYRDEESFRAAFRGWYKNIRNKDLYPEIWDYLIALNLDHNRTKQRIKSVDLFSK